MRFTFYSPTKVYFGDIDFNQLCNEIDSFGLKVLILSGGQSTTNIANQIVSSIYRNNPKYQIEHFNGIISNPLNNTIEKISQQANKPDVIISVGGGSVHDSAKALSILFSHQGTVEQFTVDGSISVRGITKKTLPVITIPTIFGSGAEISPAALIRINDKKRVIFSPNIYPKSTFICSAYASTASKKIILNSAIDALVQGIESYVSILSQDFSKNFSLSAINRIVNYLVDYSSAIDNPTVLQEISLAAIESIYAVGQTSVGAVHALSDPLSGMFNIHHGEAVGFLLPTVIETNYTFAKEKYDRIKWIFDNKLGITHPSLKESIFDFYERIGFDYKSVSLRLKNNEFEKKINQCVKDSFNSDLEGNPRILDENLIEEIFCKALG